jgi:hypothetical protein
MGEQRQQTASPPEPEVTVKVARISERTIEKIRRLEAELQQEEEEETVCLLAVRRA